MEEEGFLYAKSPFSAQCDIASVVVSFFHPLTSSLFSEVQVRGRSERGYRAYKKLTLF